FVLRFAQAVLNVVIMFFMFFLFGLSAHCLLRISFHTSSWSHTGAGRYPGFVCCASFDAQSGYRLGGRYDRTEVIPDGSGSAPGEVWLRFGFGLPRGASLRV